MLLEKMFNLLLKNGEFFSIVFLHLNEDYFAESEQLTVFRKISEFYEQYQKQPSVHDVKLLLETDTSISEEQTDEAYTFLDQVDTCALDIRFEALVKETEKWCQQRALELGILESVEIITNKKESIGKIEEIIKKALSVCFDVHIGHDYFDDAAQRLKWYYDDEEVIPFDIEALNTATGGGLRRKALGVFMAPPKRGKSLFLCHSAASFIRSGQNVLYLTCELSEKMISKRIDANLLDIEMGELNPRLDKNKFKDRFKKVFSQSHGKLIVKEYPSGTLTSNHIRNLLRELKGKKDFIPDVIIIDYLNICASSTLSSQLVGNTNLYVGKIVIEMRAIAQEYDVAMLSAVQNNRGSVKKGTETGMDDLADAFSIAMNVDWGGAIIQSDELRDMRKYLIKTVLTRWDENANDVYTIGVEYSKMKLLNLDESEQEIPQHIKDKLKYEEDQRRAVEEHSAFDFS